MIFFKHFCLVYCSKEKRVIRKVLHSTGKISDPLLIFYQLDQGHNGSIDPSQLREGLERTGKTHVTYNAC